MFILWCWFSLQHLAESCIYKSYFVRGGLAACMISSLHSTGYISFEMIGAFYMYINSMVNG